MLQNSPTSKAPLHLVTTGDLEIETERLVSLGATQTDDSDPQTVVLTDPDGNKFELAVR